MSDPSGMHNSTSVNAREVVSTWADRSLASYVVAASAAGVGLLALAQSAQAEIVHTKTHVNIPFTSGIGYKLDINHDGIPDFGLRNDVFGDEGVIFVLPAVHGNQILGTTRFASALSPGASIGPAGPFRQRSFGSMEHWNDFSGFFYSYGPWKQTRNHYLGFKFLIDGQVHFGWARLDVKGSSVLLTGYAYETIPNKPIKTGQIDDNVAPAPASLELQEEVQPSIPSLGALALGMHGLKLWRREDAATVSTSRDLI